MATGSMSKKRSSQDSTAKPETSRPRKKQKKQPKPQRPDNESESGDDASTFRPVNLLDSDDEAGLDATVDEAASASDSESAPSSDSEEDDASPARHKLKKRKPVSSHNKRKHAQDAPDDDSEDADHLDDSDTDSVDSASGSGEDDDAPAGKRPKSKRNDPTAFATSLQKILNTKLSTGRRADPLLSRSADAQKASREVVDAALEAKARKQMRQQKLAALEKGRVRDVLVATSNEVTGELETSTAEILETERRLRKVTQRGVVKLFNAVRQAQVRGAEAEAQAKKDGFVGVKGRQEKVTEMSRKGFLDLIASGGGGLKKGGIEEA